jgi:predicted MFS family arabinose efflux permease
MGIKQAGVQVGAFLLGFLLPMLATARGWRFSIGLLALVPVVAAVAIAWLIPRDTPSPETVSSRMGRRGRRLERAVWWMAGYALLMGAGVAAFGAYLPLYIQEDVGLSLSTAGAIAGAIGLIGIFARVCFGWVSERFGRYALSLAIMGIGAVAATLLVLAATRQLSWILWPAAALFGVSAITWNTVGMIAVLAEVGDDDAGRASGYVQSGFYGGYAISPVLFGYSVDTTGAYSLGWLAVAIVFVVATGVALLWHRSHTGVL